jgi:nitroimidazol reductase NimA-like FMN-containing flavoprotein (pyridoxamine 5'-phosphate oxidase superfamily)
MSNDNLSTEPASEEPMEILGESECWALLREVSVGRIAFPTPSGGVDIFPVNHFVDGGSIVFRTAAGAKLTGATLANEVVFEADGSDEENILAWSVILKGHAEMISTATDLFKSFELNVRPWHASSKPYFVRVVPTSTTGRRFKIDHHS